MSNEIEEVQNVRVTKYRNGKMGVLIAKQGQLPGNSTQTSLELGSQPKQTIVNPTPPNSRQITSATSTSEQPGTKTTPVASATQRERLPKPITKRNKDRQSAIVKAWGEVELDRRTVEGSRMTNDEFEKKRKAAGNKAAANFNLKHEKQVNQKSQASIQELENKQRNGSTKLRQAAAKREANAAAALAQAPAPRNASANPPAASNPQPAASSQQPASSSQQPAASNQQAAASNQQQAASNQQPASSNQQPAASNQQAAASSQQPAASNQQPASSSQQQQGGRRRAHRSHKRSHKRVHQSRKQRKQRKHKRTRRAHRTRR